jgi:hypothetical protein
MGQYLSQQGYDWGLGCISSCANRLYLSSASSANWNDLISGSTGSAIITCGSPGPGDGGTGRMVVIPSSSGSIWSTTSAGTTGCYCLLAFTGSVVIASGSLGNSQSTTVGNGWSLPAFSLKFSAPQ